MRETLPTDQAVEIGRYRHRRSSALRAEGAIEDSSNIIVFVSTKRSRSIVEGEFMSVLQVGMAMQVTNCTVWHGPSPQTVAWTWEWQLTAR